MASEYFKSEVIKVFLKGTAQTTQKHYLQFVFIL